jgi:ribose transport system permease protein
VKTLSVGGNVRTAPRRLEWDRVIKRSGWTVAVYLVLLALLAFTVVIHPTFGAFDVQSLVVGALPLAFAAIAQTCVVLGGGIDLSIGAMMAVANVLAARYMVGHSLEYALAISALILLAGVLAGALNGALAVYTRVPDIVVTLAMSFVWGGVALLIMAKPGGGAPTAYQDLATGTALGPWIPNALLLLVVVTAVVWLPLRRSRPGLAIYAVGSDSVAAFRSGIGVGGAKVLSYLLGGFFAAWGGLALTMSTGIGSPTAGTIYTLSGISAIVLGGVSLAGGRGGLLGPIGAAFILTLVPSDLILLGTDPNLGQVIQGVLIVFVVMAGGLAALLRRRRS